MQKIGRKSFVKFFSVTNTSNPKKPHIIRVQANKNHGICDIVLGYNEYKDKQRVFVPVRRLTEHLTHFQGRQYDDADIMFHIHNVLEEALNF